MNEHTEIMDYLDFSNGKRDGIIVDVDGTLADMTGIRTPFEWNKVNEDKPKQTIIDIVKTFRKYHGVDIIITTGRDGVCGKKTKQWLYDNEVIFDAFFIRDKDNYEKDSVIKKRIFENEIKDRWNIKFVLDDRNQVVDMWRRELGLVVLQVDEGNF
tara:strand:- start:1069 stop:1536 length:468 start_codon:yes stop_codon:yes gene_type:complete